jgi:hypothetical protein
MPVHVPQLALEDAELVEVDVAHIPCNSNSNSKQLDSTAHQTAEFA